MQHIYKFIDKWKVFFLILSCNMPNPYIGTVAAGLFLCFVAMTRLRIHHRTEWDQINFCWFLIFIIPVLSFLANFSHLNNLFWYVFTTVPILIYPAVLSNVPYENVLNSFKKFVLLELAVFSTQYMWLAVKFRTLNPLAVDLSAGDFIAGTSVGYSSLMSVTMAFLTLFFLDHYFFTKKRAGLVYSFLCFMMMILTGYMAGIVLFFISIILNFISNISYSMVRLKLSKLQMILSITMLLAFSVLCMQMSSNVIYASKVIIKIFSASPPLKVQSYIVTFSDFLKENPEQSILGVGGGNYSSRAAFMTGGQYLQPSNPWYVPVTPSRFYNRYMSPLFEKRFLYKTIGNVSSRSMINTPFSQIQTIFSEGGLLSLIILFALSIMCIRIYLRKMSRMYLIAIILFFSLLLIDNWLAFPNFAFLFWVTLFFNDFSAGKRDLTARWRTQN
ncbi:MAG: hypothetical protein GX293_01630 [Bacteroidales bacterium]|nr:hypothetical protein [Bacteroidales bacterium]